MTTLPPAPAAASAADAPACIIGALPPSMAATILVLPPTRMSSTSSPSAVKYPASLAIQVVAQLVAKLGYKRRMEVAAQKPFENGPAINRTTNAISEIVFENILAPVDERKSTLA